jgi:hypothetical protein
MRMLSVWKAEASRGRDEMTMSRSSSRDAVHPVDGRLGFARRLHGEDVIPFVLGEAGLVRPKTSERGRDRRRLETDSRDGVEIHGVGGHIASAVLDADQVRS